MSKKMDASQRLKNNITLYQADFNVKQLELKQQFYTTYEGLKPINFLKSLIKDAEEDNEIQNSVVANASSLVSDFLFSNSSWAKSNNKFKVAAVSIGKTLFTNLASLYADEIQQFVH